MDKIKNWFNRFRDSLEGMCAWVYNAMGQGEYEIGAPCPACGRSMLYYGSDSTGTWFHCPSCGKTAHRRRE